MSKYDTDEWLDSSEQLGQDWDLSRLVDLANNQNLQLGITVVVGGTFYSGILVSDEEYWETRYKVVQYILGESSTPDESAEEETIEDSKDTTRVPRFLHLKNPVVPGTSLVFGRGSGHPYIRFKIASIDGWILGAMSQ